METRKQAHVVYRCEYHIVLTTRYRRKIFVKGVKSWLKIKLLELRKFYPDIEYMEINIQPEHVHLVMCIPPKYSVGSVIRIIKTNTAKTMRERFDFLRYVFYGHGGIWSVGYFASTIGLDEDKIMAYVRYQEREDFGQAKLELR